MSFSSGSDDNAIISGMHAVGLKKNLVVAFRICLLITLGGVLPFLFLPTAQAHDTLLQAVPEKDQHLQQAPPTVQLRFSATPLKLGTTLMVVDDELRNWVTGEPQISPNTVTQKLKNDMPDGYYQFRWRVVSSDGHTISSFYNFSVGDLDGKNPVPEVGAQGQEAKASPPAAGQAQPVDTRQTRTSTMIWLAVSAGVSVMLVAIVVAWVIKKNKCSTIERPHKS